MRTFDFRDGKGPVPAHQHSFGGGWVADTAKVDSTAYVGHNARVYGNAKVYNNACVSGNARVSRNAIVLKSSDVIFGYAGEYHWTAFRDGEEITLVYGCETHYLKEWKKLHKKLAIKHNKPGHERITRLVASMVKKYFEI